MFPEPPQVIVTIIARLAQVARRNHRDAAGSEEEERLFRRRSRRLNGRRSK